MEDIPALWIEFRTSDSNHRGLHRLPGPALLAGVLRTLIP